MTALVSIVMPAYNRAQTIHQSLDSCLAQTHEHLEIVVVNDGSRDATADVVRDYAQRDERVRLISQPNAGPAIARNNGIQACRGDYIQFCDSDDILLPTKIARSLATLEEARARDERVVLAYCPMRHVAEDGQTLLDMPDMPLLKHDNTFCEVLRSNGSPIQTSTILALKEALLMVGAYRMDAEHCAEDWDLLLRLACHYEFVAHDEALVHYRHTSSALSTHALKMARGRLQTFAYARDYAPRRACMADDEYDRLLAGRYHVLAMVCWRRGDSTGARRAFQQAIATSADGRRTRHLLRALTYLAPARYIDRYFG